MDVESAFDRSIIAEFHSLDIQGDQMDDEVYCSYIQRYQMEGESGVTGSIIDEHLSSDMIKWKVKVVLLEASLMNFILGISKEIKEKVKVVLLEV